MPEKAAFFHFYSAFCFIPREISGLGSCGAERLGAFGAGADGAEVVVAVDAGGMAVGEADLDGVVADDGGGFGAWLGLEHGERRKRAASGSRGRESLFLAALVVARGAGTLFAQIGKCVVARVAVGPGDVDAGARLDVHSDGCGLSSRIEWNGHLNIS